MATMDQMLDRGAAIRVVEHFGLDVDRTPADNPIRLEGRRLEIDQLKVAPDGSFVVESYPPNTFARETHTFVLGDEDRDTLRDLTAPR